MPKREPIEPKNGNQRLVRRDEQGQFMDSDDLRKSLAQDVRVPTKTQVKSGQGARGGQNR